MQIGVVKEIKRHEYRVGLTPDNVRAYLSHGHQVLVEASAGLGSGFPDAEYAGAGARIIPAAADVWTQSDMVIKVKEPLAEEYPFLRPGLLLYTYLHLAADRPLTEALLKNKVKGIAYETITDSRGGLPLLKPMSEVAGRLSIQEGAKYLEKPFGGKGVLLSGVTGVPKARVTIIGGGVVGTNACKIAVGMGAEVTILDLNLERLVYLDDIFGNSIQTLYATPQNIEQATLEADLLIGAVLIPGASAPKLVKRDYLPRMHTGSVIVDVAVDQGGCFETTKATYHDAPTYEIDGIVHYCVANMPGAVPRTSTIALTNATLFYGLAIADKGLEQAAGDDPGILAGINTYDGYCTYANVAAAVGQEYTDIHEYLPVSADLVG